MSSEYRELLDALNDLNNLTNAQTATVGAMLGFTMALAFAWYVLTVIASWRIIEKAGDKGWKALIPFYNVYILYKIAGVKNWFWPFLGATLVASIVTSIPDVSVNMAFGIVNPGIVILLLACAVVCIISQVKFSINMAKAFGKDSGFAVGLFFLQPIFEMILGFGKAKYNKKFLEESKKEE